MYSKIFFNFDRGVRESTIEPVTKCSSGLSNDGLKYDDSHRDEPSFYVTAFDVTIVTIGGRVDPRRSLSPRHYARLQHSSDRAR
jgi:hypothetical protein